MANTSETPAIPASPSPEPEEINPIVSTSTAVTNGTAPARKQAIVVYEGDERWQPPRQLGFAAGAAGGEEGDASDEEDDEGETNVSGSGDDAEHGDLLAGYASDSEVCVARSSFISYMPPIIP